MSFITIDELRQAKPEALERWAKWLGVVRKPGLTPGEDHSLLIFGIIRAMKKLEMSPKGIIPSEVRKKII